MCAVMDIVMAVTIADHASERGHMGHNKSQDPVSSLSYKKGKIGPLQHPSGNSAHGSAFSKRLPSTLSLRQSASNGGLSLYRSTSCVHPRKAKKWGGAR